MIISLIYTPRKWVVTSRRVEFRILGPFEIVGPNGAISLGGAQPRRILAALLADPGRALTYARLLEVLWPNGDGPDNARRSAISYVSRLRSAIGECYVETTESGYRFVAHDATVDADRFTELLADASSATPGQAVALLDEALALYRGPAFGEFVDEWWARSAVARMGEMRLVALAERIEALAADGSDARTVADATAIVAEYPLHEPFVILAMRGLAANGRSAEALRLGHHYRAALADETGLDPSTAVVDLERAVATGVDSVSLGVNGTSAMRGYVLRELIGEGSSGVVYRASHASAQRDVAIKVIRADLADKREFILRFEAEAQLIARLEHPHIVPLYDFWRQPGAGFLVFRLMRGGNTQEMLGRHGPLSVARVSTLVEDIGGALVVAHSLRIVHNDLKPANILFDESGVGYLSDFGIATKGTALRRDYPRRNVAAHAAVPTEVTRVPHNGALEDQRAFAAMVEHLLGWGAEHASAVSGVSADSERHAAFGGVLRRRAVR